jgi:hypothetical protein
MNISFAPLRSDSTLTVSRQDEALILNGKTFGFSDLPEGARLQREAIEFDWFAADITRTAGALQITLVLPQSVMDPADGPIPLPGANETGDAE